MSSQQQQTQQHRQLPRDKPKSAIDHMLDFTYCEAQVKDLGQNNLALKCGIESGLIVLKIDLACMSTYHPKIRCRRYPPVHTYIGQVLHYTKKIITSQDETWPIIGLCREEWPDGFPSCMLVEPKKKDAVQCTIELLADGKQVLIEPSVDSITNTSYHFYTPLHADGYPVDTENYNSLWELGIFTLHRYNFEHELFPAFGRRMSRVGKTTDSEEVQGGEL